MQIRKMRTTAGSIYSASRSKQKTHYDNNTSLNLHNENIQPYPKPSRPLSILQQKDTNLQNLSNLNGHNMTKRTIQSKWAYDYDNLQSICSFKNSKEQTKSYNFQSFNGEIEEKQNERKKYGMGFNNINNFYNNNNKVYNNHQQQSNRSHGSNNSKKILLLSNKLNNMQLNQSNTSNKLDNLQNNSLQSINSNNSNNNSNNSNNSNNKMNKSRQQSNQQSRRQSQRQHLLQQNQFNTFQNQQEQQQFDSLQKYQQNELNEQNYQNNENQIKLFNKNNNNSNFNHNNNNNSSHIHNQQNKIIQKLTCLNNIFKQIKMLRMMGLGQRVQNSLGQVEDRLLKIEREIIKDQTGNVNNSHVDNFITSNMKKNYR